MQAVKGPKNNNVRLFTKTMIDPRNNGKNSITTNTETTTTTGLQLSGL